MIRKKAVRKPYIKAGSLTSDGLPWSAGSGYSAAVILFNDLRL